MIHIRNVSLKYDNDIALEDVSLDINNGDFLGVLGPNGAGKSTLFKIILGLLEPQNGEVQIADNAVISYVPQGIAFDKTFPIKVKDVILMGLLSSKISFFRRFSDSEKDSVNLIMKKLNISELQNRQVGELSGGQLQKVLIARALIRNPQIILLDEPTSNLDSGAKREIFELLKEINKTITVVIVSHNIDLACEYVNKTVLIDKKIKYYGEPNEKFIRAFS